MFFLYAYALFLPDLKTNNIAKRLVGEINIVKILFTDNNNNDIYYLKMIWI